MTFVAFWAWCKRAFDWLKDHTAVAAALAGAAAALLFTRSRSTAFDRLGVQLDAIDAKSHTAKLAAEQGAKAAHEHVLSTYSQELESLNEKQLHEAQKLAEDPAGLAAFLVRAGAATRAPKP